MREVGGSRTAYAARGWQNLNDWASVAELDEGELSRRLYPVTCATAVANRQPRPLPDWIRVREELARADHQMTLALLWGGVQRSASGRLPVLAVRRNYIDASRKRLSVVLRQPHRGRREILRGLLRRPAAVSMSTPAIESARSCFVGALGASSYTFAWATLSQDLPTWLDCHVRMYEFFYRASARLRFQII